MWTNYIFLFLSLFNAEAQAPAAAELPEAPQAQLALAVSTAPTSAAHKPARKAQKPRRFKQSPKPKAALATPAQPVPTLRVAADEATAPAKLALGKVQDLYNSTTSFKANFTQTVTNQTFNKLKPTVSKGRIYILTPGKMRWDYKNKSYKAATDPKVSKSFISDGKYLWAVMHKNKQYYKQDLGGSTLPVAVSFLMGTGDLLKEFNVAFDTAGKFGSKSDVLLLLTPKTPSARYKKLWLVVDSSNHSVKQSVVLNSKGDTNAIRFTGAKTNDGTLKSGHFIFNAKANKGYRLVKQPKK